AHYSDAFGKHPARPGEGHPLSPQADPGGFRNDDRRQPADAAGVGRGTPPSGRSSRSAAARGRQESENRGQSPRPRVRLLTAANLPARAGSPRTRRLIAIPPPAPVLARR